MANINRYNIRREKCRIHFPLINNEINRQQTFEYLYIFVFLHSSKFEGYDTLFSFLMYLSAFHQRRDDRFRPGGVQIRLKLVFFCMTRFLYIFSVFGFRENEIEMVEKRPKKMFVCVYIYSISITA